MKIDRKIKNIILFILSASLLGPAPLLASDNTQLSDERQNTAIKQEDYASQIEMAGQSISQASAKPVSAGIFSFQYGGWAETTYRSYRNLDNQKSLEDFLKWSWTQDASLWMQWSYDSTYSAYLQIFDSYVDRGVGPTYTGIGADHQGPSIFMAYGRADLSAKYGIPLTMTLGRQHLFLGRGLTYSAIHDGLEVKSYLQDFYFKFFASVTQPHEDNIDFSVPGFDKLGKRLFIGGQADYTGIPDVSLHLYALRQKDLSSADSSNDPQNYHYDSNYFGAGADFNPWKGMELYSEAVWENGQGYTDASQTVLQKTKIGAFSCLAGASYHFEAATHPVAEITYAYASGDSDRTSVTNAIGGPLDGKDANFLYFGSYFGGYALQPRLSNLSILEAGGSFQPFEQSRFFSKLAVGTKYYLYQKDKAEGFMSNPQSGSNSSDVGSEVDFYAHWMIRSDLILSARYGIFFAGEAFPENTRDNTAYFFSNLIFLF